MSSNDDKRLAIDFIDPLFAVVLHISVVEGVMKATWFRDPSTLGGWDELSQLLAWLVSVLFVAWSWVGYHQSIAKANIDISKLAGQLRFLMDILLLGLYWLLLVSFEHLLRMAGLLVVIYAVYVIWDTLKWIETGFERDPTADTSLRRGVTTFWLGIFALMFVLYSVLLSSGFPREPLAAFALVLIFLFTLLYRAHKDHKWLKCVLGRLSFAWI